MSKGIVAPPLPNDDEAEPIYQLHLSGFGYSGRGVRVRQLDQETVRAIESEAARDVGTEGTVYDMSQATVWEGLCRMVSEVTTSPVRGTRRVPDPKKPDGTIEIERTLNDDDVQWRRVTLQEMKGASRRLFTSKDIAMLGNMYHRLHTVSQLEVEVIMGKALPVSAGD